MINLSISSDRFLYFFLIIKFKFRLQKYSLVKTPLLFLKNQEYIKYFVNLSCILSDCCSNELGLFLFRWQQSSLIFNLNFNKKKYVGWFHPIETPVRVNNCPLFLTYHCIIIVILFILFRWQQFGPVETPVGSEGLWIYQCQLHRWFSERPGIHCDTGIFILVRDTGIG